ncbi:Membrane proteinase PrsW, cleaves anti-sigma factor RsiW, M82 family [Flavobacteriaceae bacterium MAR_2010_188]|nr:Membrane proteinase PrsW, cleaves anti-sigma factor RsiW, M82 family [Flavobacteriaceae bacterium MAR_2010_188]
MAKIFRNIVATTFLITVLCLVLFYPLVLIHRFGWYDLFLLSLAITPGIFIMVTIYNLDQYDKEPLWLLSIAYIFGAIILYADIDILEYIFNSINVEKNILGVGEKSLIVGVTEEILKFIIVLFIIFPNKHFDEPFDGIVYSVFVAMGFATAENLTFVMQGSSSTALLRMISAIPAHFVFAVIMGYYLGKAKSEKKLVYLVLSLLLPIAIHTIYDYFLFLDFIPGIWIGGLVTLVLALFLAKNSILAHLAASPFREDNISEEK